VDKKQSFLINLRGRFSPVANLWTSRRSS